MSRITQGQSRPQFAILLKNGEYLSRTLPCLVFSKIPAEAMMFHTYKTAKHSIKLLTEINGLFSSAQIVELQGCAA